MIIYPRPRRRPARADAGVSVMELSVAMAVATFLMAAVCAVWVGALHTVRTMDASTSSDADARTAMEAISRTLRVAYKPDGQASAFTAASPAGVTFWALLNRTGAPSTTEPTPTQVSYSYSGGCVVETQTLGAQVRRLCLLRTSRPPVFTYYPSPALTSGGNPVAPVPATPAVAPTDLPSIQSVEVSLRVQDPDHPAQDAVSVVNRVTLTNVVPGAGA
jgi:hypothetical protein